MENFAKLLKEYRLRQKCSQASVAEKCNISRMYITLLERGEKNAPQKELVLSIASALELSDEERKQLLEAAEIDRLNHSLLKHNGASLDNLAKCLKENLSKSQLLNLSQKLQQLATID